jgi:RNA polymerase sigma-70 factor (ECF subfamily)
MDHQDEERLVERCREGDMTAYRLLYERFEQPFLRTALRMLGRRQEAEEAVQETFLKLYRNIRGFHRGARFSTYFFAILMNTCRDALRRRGSAEFDDVDPETLSAGSRSELAFTLADAIDRLPGRMKACFLLFAVEGLSHGEIAAILDVSTGSVKTHVHRARLRLRAGLADSSSGEAE